jgi:hypothetical protein
MAKEGEGDIGTERDMIGSEDCDVSVFVQC